MICSRIAQKWRYKLKYEYKDVHKDMFINRHERPDIAKDYKVFLEKIEKLKSYMMEFDENNKIKPKVYLLDCIV